MAESLLTEDEGETSTRWTRRRTSSQALALRCRIVLESATGATNKDVAARSGIEAHTSRWRARFVRDRLEGRRAWPMSHGRAVLFTDGGAYKVGGGERHLQGVRAQPGQ
ncbi:helix-turn-helix domain-containing protein [Streptomyces sp. NPDC058409]|uniref:helix-turn-helix domain-containing protein n=1 Tax=Streptomyces sp. NPDC058409 TaxID=3346484 RepID=UPI00364C288E